MATQRRGVFGGIFRQESGTQATDHDQDLVNARAFLMQQLNRTPADYLQRAKHIAWCRRECAQLGVPVPEWFALFGSAGDADESIIGDYYPSTVQPAAAAATSDDGTEGEDEEEGEDLDDEDEEDEGDERWDLEPADEDVPGEDDDDPPASHWLTVEAGILVSEDGTVAAGYAATPRAAPGALDTLTQAAALAEARALQERAMSVLSHAEAVHDHALALAALGEARACLALAARLAGILDHA